MGPKPAQPGSFRFSCLSSQNRELRKFKVVKQPEHHLWLFTQMGTLTLLGPLHKPGCPFVPDPPHPGAGDPTNQPPRAGLTPATQLHISSGKLGLGGQKDRSSNVTPPPVS